MVICPPGFSTPPQYATSEAAIATYDRLLLDWSVLVGEADYKVAEEAIRDQAEHAQADNANENLIRSHPQARVEDQEAEAGVRRNHLGRHYGGE
jgi:hypothetical protein